MEPPLNYRSPSECVAGQGRGRRAGSEGRESRGEDRLWSLGRSAPPLSAPQDKALLRGSSWEEAEVMEIELEAMSLVSWIPFLPESTVLLFRTW